GSGRARVLPRHGRRRADEELPRREALQAPQALAVVTPMASENWQTLPALTLPQMLREQARSRAHAVAIRQKEFGIWKPITWEAYYRRARHFGLGLRALGVPAGGHVGVISENRVEW